MFLEHRGKILFLAGALLTLAAGWTAFPVALFQRVSQPVDFSHKIHADKAGTKCEDCHAIRADGTFAGIPPLDKCSGCHAQPMGTTAQERHFIQQYVTPNREVPWQVDARQPGNVYFSHAFHARRARLDCRQCHGNQGESDTLPPVRINRISGYSGSPHFLNMNACEDCHRQRGVANSCLACHQ
jgi:hypothetical protein